MKTLRYVVTTECSRKCKECCNNQYDLDSVADVRHFEGYDEIVLTGGEPLEHTERLAIAIARVRSHTLAPIYVYTAKTDDINALLWLLSVVDGITITLHEQSDVVPFIKAAAEIDRRFPHGKSLRLNVFKGITGVPSLPRWDLRSGYVWVVCGIPDHETLAVMQ